MNEKNELKRKRVCLIVLAMVFVDDKETEE